ncbi:MAG TPA: TlpA disulfide reductase family protein [Candidatus Eremiobacteraceae bacterium]|nr:TlpA disulfide reductase family protein [Candidatus Eremiobacteraceae bacterium]
MPLRTILPIVLGVLVVGAIIIYAWTQMHKLPSAAVAPNAIPSVPPPHKEGSLAPAFSLQTPLGPISNDTFAGKPYMLELFATWCPHCQRMTAVLRSLRAKLPESRFGMVSVTGSPYGAGSTEGSPVAESQADVDQFDKYFNITWPSAFDPDLKVAQTWGLDGFPTIYIVNAKGTIVFAGSGEMPESRLLEAARKAGA